MQTHEFEIGDRVTFFPYEKEIPAIVKAISHYNVFGLQDGRIFYSLVNVKGANYHDKIKTTTHGKCIKESKYFEQWNGIV